MSPVNSAGAISVAQNSGFSAGSVSKEAKGQEVPSDPFDALLDEQQVSVVQPTVPPQSSGVPSGEVPEKADQRSAGEGVEEQGANDGMDVSLVASYFISIPFQQSALVTPLPQGIASQSVGLEPVGLPLSGNEAQTSQPIVQQPMVQQPMVQQPMVQQPMVQQLMVQQPMVQQPMVQQPMVQQPMVQQPMVQQPMVQQPMVQQPMVQQPMVQQLMVQQPMVQQPMVQQPMVQQPMVQQPMVQQPMVQQPMVQQPMVQQPMVQQPMVQQPMVQQPVPQQPVVQQLQVSAVASVDGIPTASSASDAKREQGPTSANLASPPAVAAQVAATSEPISILPPFIKTDQADGMSPALQDVTMTAANPQQKKTSAVPTAAGKSAPASSVALKMEPMNESAASSREEGGASGNQHQPSDSQTQPANITVTLPIMSENVSARGNSAEFATRVDRADQMTAIFHQVTEATEKMRSDGRTNVELNVRMKDGQEVTIQLHMQEGQMRPVFKTDSQELRIALEQNWGQFSSNAGEKGLRAASAVFQSPQSGLPDFNQRQNQQQPAPSETFSREDAAFIPQSKPRAQTARIPESPSTSERTGGLSLFA